MQLNLFKSRSLKKITYFLIKMPLHHQWFIFENSFLWHKLTETSAVFTEDLSNFHNNRYSRIENNFMSLSVS